MKNLVIDSPIVQYIMDQLEQQGITDAQLLASTGIVREQAIKIPYEQLIKLIVYAQQVMNNPALSLQLRNEAKVAPQHFVAWLCAHAPTLHQTLEILDRYGCLIFVADDLTVSIENQHVTISYRNLACAPTTKAIIEYYLAFIFHLFFPYFPYLLYFQFL